MACVGDDALLHAYIADATVPSNWVVTGQPQSQEVIAFMLPKNDDAFKELVDGAIAAAQTSGDAAAIYEKWFTQPMPPRRRSLDLPLSDELKKLFTSPNDKLPG